MTLRRALARTPIKTAVAALVAVLAIPAVAEAASTLAVPDKGKLNRFGHVVLTVDYSCPSTTSPEDSILWLYSTQDQPSHFAAGDTAVDVTCDGKRRRYRADLGPNIGEASYTRGTVFIEAFLGYGGDTIHAHDAAVVAVR